MTLVAMPGSSANSSSGGSRTLKQGSAPTNHFRPKPMSPPWKGCTPEEYTNYVASYKIYVAALNDAKAEFWESATPASRNLPRKVVKVDPDSLRNPVVFRLETADKRVLGADLPTYAQALQQRKDLTAHGWQESSVDIVQRTKAATLGYNVVGPKQVSLPDTTPTKAQAEAKAARKTAARRRQRHNRVLRDREAAVKELKLKAELESAKLRAAKSSQQLQSWVTVSNRRASKLPVKTGPSPTTPPTSRPVWYPTTKEAALRLQKMWGPGS